MKKLLIVDDEIQIRELIKKYATFEGYEIDEASNGLEAIEKVNNSNQYDLIIMDIMMPELDGFSAVKEIRKSTNIPVIMLSARSEEYDKLYGFDLGIDDYVTKPFSPKELMMRIAAILNRYSKGGVEKQEKSSNIIEYKDLKIDIDAHLVFLDAKRIDLTPKEFEILFILITNPNIAITRKQLLEKIWGSENKDFERTLDTHIKSLRKKIGSYAHNIITIRRVGYRFENK